MLLPALSKAREKARATVCLANLKQLGIAFTIYVDDWEGYLPQTADNGGGYWMTPIAWYASRLTGSGSGWQDWTKKPSVFLCPSDRRPFGKFSTAPRGGTSYAMNYYLGEKWNPDVNSARFHKISEIKKVSKFVVLGEAEYACWLAGKDQTTLHILTGTYPAGLPNYHGGGNNFLFLDGSVRWSIYFPSYAEDKEVWAPWIP